MRGFSKELGSCEESFRSNHRYRKRFTDQATDAALIFAAAPFFMYAALLGLPLGHSYGLNIGWYESFRAALADGDLYPRWLAGLWNGAGGADFFFYAPLPFWLAAIIEFAVCTGCAPAKVLNLTGIFMLALSGIAFRHFALRYADRYSSLLAALVYMMLPYHLVDWFDRQAIGEFMAYIILPLHLAALLDWLEGKGRPLRFAALTALLILTHLPSVIVIAVFEALLVVIYPSVSVRKLAGAGIAAAAGVGIASIYWLPAIGLLDIVDVKQQIIGHNHWERWLLSSRTWAEQDNFYRSLWPPFFTAVFVCSASAAWLWRASPRVARVALLAAAIAVIMSIPLSSPLWQLPPFRNIQFPFRYFILTDLSVALVTSVLMQQILQRRAFLVPAAVTGIVVFACLWWHPISRPLFGFETGSWSFAARTGAYEWLAKPSDDAFLPWERHVKAVANLREINPQIGEAHLIRDEARRMDFVADLPKDGEVVFKRTWWPFWRLVDERSGREIPISRTEGFPLIAADLPAGQGRYRLELPTLAIEQTGMAISLFSLLAALLWEIRTRRRARTR